MPIIQHLASMQQAERRGLPRPAEVVIRLPAGTSADGIRDALNVLAGRHELLRSRLAEAPDGVSGLVQQLTEKAELSWSTEASGRTATGSVTGGELRAVFTAGDPPLLRLSLPSTCTDLGSLAVLAHDLLSVLDGEILPEPVQNSQYAAWQSGNRGGSGSVTADLARLFPTGGERTAAAGGPQAGVARDLPYTRLSRAVEDEQWASVRSAAQHLGLEVDQVLLAAWLICLWRVDRAPGAGAGTYFDHRAVYGELAGTVGVLSRYLPFCVDIADDDTVRDVALRVAERHLQIAGVLDDFRWHDLPEGTYDCDSRQPRLPVLYASLPVSSEKVLDRADLSELSHEPSLALQVLFTSMRARFQLDYRPDVVMTWRARALCDGYAAILGAMADSLDRRVGELPLLGEAARRQMLQTFGRAPERAELADRSVYELFAEQVRRSPDRIAIVDGSNWSYADLEKRAGSVAAAVSSRGLSPGERVAILMDRGAGMVAAVLGVWRAGLAYVPIDPGSPPERIEFMLRDSDSKLLLTDLAEADIRSSGAVPSIDLRLLAAGQQQGPDDIPAAAEPGGAGLAYVIYTSGTTGRPKGVMISHGSAVNLARAHHERIYRHHDPDGRGLRASFNASLAFDGAVERVLLLLSGHTLYLTGEDTRRDPEAFAAFARRNDLEVLDVTPTFLTLLVRAGLFREPGYQPKAVLVGGEAVSPWLWNELAASDVACYNVYGPTECTVNAAVGLIGGDRPHLGLALPNTRLYILDEARQPQPAGVAGEIHISGAGVGRGYLGQPELTAAKFRPNPYAMGDGTHSILYATGDIGRFLADGTIEYLGRRDGQIKLRGFRIELAEIAAVLRADPAVEDALVRVHGATSDNARLAAYVVAQEEARPGLASRLAAGMARKLPGYMIPGDIFVLPAFPLTANGKIDEAALPVPGAGVPSSDGSQAPDDDLEAALVRIWEGILQKRGIGTRENFFAAGGHSLLVPLMIGQIKQELGVPLPLRTVFTAPTISDIARVIESKKAEQQHRAREASASRGEID